MLCLVLHHGKYQSKSHHETVTTIQSNVMSNPMSKERGVYGRVPRGAVSPLEDSPRDAQKRVGKTQETLRLLLRPERGIFLWVRILKSDF